MSEDITDLTNFGICAGCDLVDVSESATRCPNCDHDLGNCNICVSI